LVSRNHAAGQLDRCWLSPEEKRNKRVVGTGDFGLEAPAA
jgi:hypothetical protein